MVRAATVFLLIASLSAPLATLVRAQTGPGPTSPTPAPASPVLAPAASAAPAESPPSAAPRRSRAISSEAAAALAAASPKYTPPPPKPPPKPEEELVDLREVDKPKNTIVRLPKYIVQEKKPPIFRERDIYTAKGLTELAMRRYISDADRALNRFKLPLFGIAMETRALAMYAEDERLRQMSDLNDAAINASRSDPAAGSFIRREAQKTFLRSSDFGWSSGDPR
jgi:hypothetical protein